LGLSGRESGLSFFGAIGASMMKFCLQKHIEHLSGRRQKEALLPSPHAKMRGTLVICRGASKPPFIDVMNHYQVIEF